MDRGQVGVGRLAWSKSRLSLGRRALAGRLHDNPESESHGRPGHGVQDRPGVPHRGH